MLTVILTVVACVIGALVIFACGWLLGVTNRNQALANATAAVEAYRVAHGDVTTKYWNENQRAADAEQALADLKARAYLRDGKGRIAKAADVLK